MSETPISAKRSGTKRCRLASSVRRVALVAGALLLAVGLVAILLALLVDPEELRAPVVERVSLALGREVQLGELDLALFPPALRARDIRVAGVADGDPPLLEVAELRLRISALALLTGRVVLRAVAVDSPRLHIPVDAEGMPDLARLPGAMAGEAGEREPGEDASSAEDAGFAEDTGSPITLAVQTLTVRDAQLEAGPWRVEGASARGSLELDGSGELAFDADLPGIGTLRDGRILVTGLGTDELSATITTKLGLDLAPLAERLELGPFEGRVSGPVSATLEGGQLAGAEAHLQIADLKVLVGNAALQGDAEVDATLIGEGLLELTTRLGSTELRSQVDFAAATPTLELQPGTLDLEALAPYLTGVPALTGRLELGAVRVEPEPLQVSGRVEFEDVALPLEQGEVRISGSLVGHGSELRFDAPEVRVASELATLSGTYDLAAGSVTLNGGTSGANVETLLQALRGSAELSGSLTSSASLAGPPELEAISGSGSFRLADGRIRGFSLLRQVFGDLATLPVLLAQLEGKDLSRYEEEEFESLSADYTIAEGRLTTQNLTLVYKNATAYLRGGIGLLDGALDLSGRVVLSRGVDEELCKRSSRQTVIPIAAVGGSVARPRLRLDRQALAGLALEYAAGSDRLQEKLEEAIGEEGAGTVRDLLDSLLRGNR